MNHIIDRVSFGSLMGKFIKQLQNKIATALNVPMWQLFASPEEVTGDNELTALIQHKKDFYKAVTIEELKKIVTEIEEKAD